MPPVMMTQVRASASKPSSTARRTISPALAPVRKLCAVAPNSAISERITHASTHSWLGKNRSSHGSLVDSSGEDAMFLRSRPSIGNHADENNGALRCLFPIRIHAQKSERGADHAKQRDTEQSARQGAASAGNRRSTHHHRGDHFHLQTDARV